MKIKFKISEFIIEKGPIPVEVCDKILQHHITPMINVRKLFGSSLWPSQKSGYRSVKWEKSRGRSGNSQHTFSGKGAVDWTCKNFKDNKEKLLKLLISNTEYTRLAVYNGFIHCDYKPTPSGKRELYDSGGDSKWVFKKFI